MNSLLKKNNEIVIGFVKSEDNKKFTEYVLISTPDKGVISYYNRNAICNKCSPKGFHRKINFSIDKLAPRNIVFKPDQGQIDIN